MSDASNVDLPQWIWDILDRYELGERTDEPLGGVIILLHDAVDELQQAYMRILEQQAATPDMVQVVKGAMAMVQDAVALAAICPTEPVPGVVEQQPDGGLLWRPLGTKEE